MPLVVRDHIAQALTASLSLRHLEMRVGMKRLIADSPPIRVPCDSVRPPQTNMNDAQLPCRSATNNSLSRASHNAIRIALGCITPTYRAPLAFTESATPKHT